MSTLQPGSTLQNGKYEIQRVLGQGGFGVTYLALQQGLNRIVAIKEFFMENFCVRNADTHHVTIAAEGSRELVERYRNKFLKEARNIAKLEHPNIVSIIDVFEENSTAYYVMKYAQNGSLDDKVKREGHLSEADAKRYILKIANALRFVHQHKMTHLDVKPANILLSDNDEPWLIDFGLSKQYDAKTGEQTSSTPLGYSPGYAPIEQYMAGGAGTFSPESDIYSLGATFYKLLTGNTPPDASTVVNNGIPVQELHAKNVSQRAISVIFQAMEPLCKDRLHDMDSFIQMLEEETPQPKPARKPTNATRTVTSEEDMKTSPSAPKPPTPPQPKPAKMQARPEANSQRSPIEQNVNPPTFKAEGRTGSPLRYLMLGVIGFFVIVAIVFGCIIVLGALLPDDTPVEENDSIVAQQLSEGPMTFEANGVSFTMIPVEGGTFTMGATSEMKNPDDDEQPTHPVTLSSYYIGETEVTQALWKAVMGSNPSYFEGDDLPVAYVSWDDCQTFISKLNALTGKNFRLPTEAEWEFAARGGNQSRHTPYSGSSRIDDVAWYRDNSGDLTHPVKTKQPNELGIYDMTGNVYEWCQDWYGSYSNYAQTNPTGASSGSDRVLRGGGWGRSPRGCRSSNRSGETPEFSNDNLGLRLVLS
ncbi:MAG: bifunctional serine/threonine-protein kinase/formylglycine-generating enzyme family protein [Alloprevotella sp.]